MFPYDDQILAAVEAAPQSVDDVIRTMQAIDTICSDGDGLKWFNWLYLGVTRAVGARVAAGGFHDAAWVGALGGEVSELYFGALPAARLDSVGAAAVRAGGDQCAHQSRSAGGDCADGRGAGTRGRAL